MVAKPSPSFSPAPASDTDVAARPWHQSPFHVKIACDACAAAILLSVVALYLAVLLVA